MIDAVKKNEHEPDVEWALINHAVARLRAMVMAVVFGLTSGVGLFLATAWLLVRGGINVGSTLGLLRHYLPGYSVTWTGAFLGFIYAAVIGGIFGWVIAYIYNKMVTHRSED